MLLRNMLVVAAILLSPLVQAQDLSLVKQEIRIPRGESRSFEFSTVPQKDHTILLDVMARLDSDTYGGSLYFMKITLNGRVVKAAK
ncbi:MAG: hypothetical protein ABFD94_14480, partial [Armatimonadia bacterium]